MLTFLTAFSYCKYYYIAYNESFKKWQTPKDVTLYFSTSYCKLLMRNYKNNNMYKYTQQLFKAATTTTTLRVASESKISAERGKSLRRR